MINVGELVRRTRLSVGISQREIELRAGYAGHFVSKVENNRHSPSIHTLEGIAEAMDMELTITMKRRRRDGNH